MPRKRVRQQAKVRIVFFGHCGNRSTSFKSLDEAQEAAQQYSRRAGYTCEAYACDKHLSSKGNTLPRWHVRWRDEGKH